MLFWNRTHITYKGLSVLLALALTAGIFAGCGTAPAPGEPESQQDEAAQSQADLSAYAAGAYDNWADNNPVYVTLAGASISVDGTGAAADGSVLTIDAPGVYVLSGTLDDGQILVQATKDDTVQLVLDGVTLSSSQSAPIYSAKAGTTVLTLADGSQNYVSDGADYVYPGDETDEPDAAVFCKNDLVITGSGSLTVQANYNNGIGSKDDLIIESGTLDITAANHGIRGRDSVTVLDGAFSIQAGNDGIQSNNDSDGKGWILLQDGIYDLQTDNDGIQAQSTLTIAGGTYTIVSGGGSAVNPADPDDSYKGLKAGGDLTIEGGGFSIDSADDAVHANGNVTIYGGNFELASGDDGVHADLSLLIHDGAINISTSYEGLEGQTVTINGGDITLYATDDGINAAGGSESGGRASGSVLCPRNSFRCITHDWHRVRMTIST